MTTIAVTAAEMFRLSVPTVDTELVGGDRRVRVPAGITDLASFRAWAHSERFPDAGRIDYLGDELWVDLSMEQLYSHNQVKAAIYVVLIALARTANTGLFLPDRMRLSYPGAGASVEPDGAYVSFDALRTGRVRRLPGRHGGALELEGPTEMVLEVVTDSSEEKDVDHLPDYYAAAGVAELWRVDARGGLRFEVFRLAADGYASAHEGDGWWRSDVFNRSVRLVGQPDALGDPSYTLEQRS
jgi:Uma2 family endonuclease